MDARQLLYNAAFNEDLPAVTDTLAVNPLHVISNEWNVNPLRGVVKAPQVRISVANILLRHAGPDLLLRARDPGTGDTLLHLAIQEQKEKLAIFFLKYLSQLSTEELNPYTKQCFLNAVNNDGQTALYIATDKLLISVIEQFVLEKQLQINTKEHQNQKTVFDLIQDKCDSRGIMDDWKTPWTISILLRGFGAKKASDMNVYEDEEDVTRATRPAEYLIMNDDAWNATTNTILIVSTMAFTSVFAAIFTVPETVAPGGGGGDNNSTATSNGATETVLESLHASLGKNTAFKLFIVSLSIACLVMALVIPAVVLIVTRRYVMRALILFFSWGCLVIMGASLTMAYLVAIWMYMGYRFTSILMACGLCITLVALFFAHYFEAYEYFWLHLSQLLSLTLVHGFVATLLYSFFPKHVAKRILHVLPFET